MLQEPATTPYDLRFRLGQIPVRVHPLFWLVGLALGSSLKVPKYVLLWVVALFVSILIHELGHALMALRFGNRPHIVLYAAGGLASYAPYRETFASRLWIIFAGPGAGFIFAGVLLLVLWLGDVSLPAHPLDRWIDLSGGTRELGDNAYALVQFILRICIWWGLINLLPIYPLDGGQIARTVLVRRDGILGPSRSLVISFCTAVGAAIVAAIMSPDNLFLPIFFAFFAFSNYQELQSQQRWR